MEETVRLTLKILNALAVLMWAGAVAFTAYRIYRLLTLDVVVAEAINAETDSFVHVSEDEDASGFRREIRQQMYRAQALVRYQYRGQQYTPVARHEKETQSWKKANRLVESWKPGTRLRVRLHPSKPDQPRLGMGINFATFQAVTVFVVGGLMFMAMSYGLKFAFAFFAKAIPPEAE